MKKYSKSDIMEILDKALKEEMQNKNRYIELNGYSHKDTLSAFDNRIAEIVYLMHKF